MNLVSTGSSDPNNFFSVHTTIVASRLALLNVELAGSRAGEPLEYGTWAAMEIQRAETRHSKRLSVWESVETLALSSSADGLDDQQILELTLLKCAEIAKALLLVNDRDNVFAWISDMRTRFAGRNYNVDELLAVAEEYSIVVHPFLTDWLTSKNLPAYSVSNPTVRRIADDERGNPRHETTLDIRNTASVDGYVTIGLVTEGSSEWSQYPSQGPNFRIDGNTSKQIKVTSVPRPYSVNVNPMLSRNREVMQLQLPEGEIEDDRTAQPGLEEVASDWAPDDPRIVIDDLDPGFFVNQPEPDTQQVAPVGLTSWFSFWWDSSNELYHGLPWAGDQYNYHISSGRLWSRLGASGAHGEYRRTYAIQRFYSGEDTYLANFTAKLPRSSTWQLEFFKPSGPVVARPVSSPDPSCDHSGERRRDAEYRIRPNASRVRLECDRQI